MPYLLIYYTPVLLHYFCFASVIVRTLDKLMPFFLLMFNLNRHICVLTLLALLLSACTTINPYTNETQTSKATIGAGAGALAGAVIGLISGDDSRERRKRAL